MLFRSPSNQAAWVLLEISRKPFGIINIYASNDAHDRKTLWRWLALSLPLATWILCGDFNMVDKYFDKKSHSPMRWNIGEREAWFFMKNKLSLFDPNASFSPNNFPEAHWFTWSNFQANINRVLKWLDRAMLSESDFFHFDKLSPSLPFVSVIPNYTLSDHAPILFAISFD